MGQGGRFNAIALERVVFGRPVAEVVPDELERLGRSRACLLVSDSLRTSTTAVSDLEQALGSAAVGTYSGMPPHTPREAVLECAALARESKADIIVTLGADRSPTPARWFSFAWSMTSPSPRGSSRSSPVPGRTGAWSARRSGRRECASLPCRPPSPGESSDSAQAAQTVRDG